MTPSVTITRSQLDAFLACTRDPGDKYNATHTCNDLFTFHAGLLSTHTALALRDRWIAAGCPRRWKHLKALIRWLVNQGELERDPIKGVPAPRVEQRKRPVIPTEKWLEMVEASRGTAIEPLILAIGMTGLCFKDACTLQWHEVDVEEGVITRKRAKLVGRQGGDCLIPLDPNGPFLKFLRERHAFKDTTLGQWPSTSGAHYVDNYLARCILVKQETWIRKLFREVAVKAGMAGVEPHDFRSTTATVLLRSVNIIHTAQVTGHLNVQSLQRYCQPDPEAVKKAVRGIYAQPA